MSLFKVRALGEIARHFQETYYLVYADNEREAIDKFKTIQPNIDPDFRVERFDIELYTSEDLAIIDESICD